MVLRWFSKLVEAIQALTDAVEAVADSQKQLGPARVRLDALERSRHQFEAECEGKLLKADGKLKAASSAEQRERQLKNANDKRLESFDPDGPAQPEPGADVLTDDAQGSPADRVLGMHMALASTNKKAAGQRAKWGLKP